jgi:hypothetical protein
MTDWPITLPQALMIDGYTEEDRDYVIQTDMTNAVPIQRMVQTAAPKPFGGKMIITLAQKQILSTFYKANCSSKFGFPRPFTGETIQIRFLDKPKYQSSAGDYLYVTLKFEEI